MQQGRVQLDADWNEQWFIYQHRTFTETKDVIGPCGAPKTNGGFRIGVAPDGTDLLISPGHMYLEGLLCELNAGTIPVTYRQQPHFPAPDLSFFSGPPSPPTSPPSSPPASPPASPPQAPLHLYLKDGAYLVYLEAWQQEVNFREDPRIQEVALGEADTATRLRTVWQVKLLKVNANNMADCDTPFPEWSQITATPTGKLNAQTVKNGGQPNPCLLPPSAGYRRLENQLYRVEVHRGGQLANTTFKWSRDNGTVETNIENINGTEITVTDIGKDDVLGFGIGQWVEIIDDASVLKGEKIPLVQIQAIDEGSRKITVSAAVTPKPDLRLRRWDQSGNTATVNGVVAGAGWLDLEDGIQIRFSGGTYRPGDYWLIPARTATGEIEWPPYTIPNTSPQEQPPNGTPHYFCRLGFIRVDNHLYTLEDCRELFPSLTSICAEDICFDNSNCQLAGVQNVQEAIDMLCANREGSCTYVAIPGPGWEEVLTMIPENQDAQICFQVGIYPLNNPVVINHNGHLKLTGAGPGTRIIAENAEAALVFVNTKSVLVRDLYAETGLIKQSEALNGTLTFESCDEVYIENVHLKCGAGAERAATCITVRNPENSPATVRVLHNELLVGYMQQGILLVNVARAVVEDNIIKVYQRPQSLTTKVLLTSPNYRNALRYMFIAGARLNNPTQDFSYINVTAGNHTVSFRTHQILRQFWPELLRIFPLPNPFAAHYVLWHLEKLTNRLFTDEVLRNQFTPFRVLFDILTRLDQEVASLGITVGGQRAGDIHIVRNIMENVMQGIHVGTSRKAIADDFTDNLQITDNTITVKITPLTGKRERYGIFVGNTRHLQISHNDIKLVRTAETDHFEVQGIHVWGLFGNRLMISENNIYSANGDPKRSFDFGIRAVSRAPRPVTAQWIIMWNVAPSKQSTVSVQNGPLPLQGTNTPL